jgi:hypothetical protein
MGQPEIGLFWVFSCQGIKAYRLAGSLGPTSEIGQNAKFRGDHRMSALAPKSRHLSFYEYTA